MPTTRPRPTGSARPAVQVATTARRSAEDDRAGRMRAYLTAMVIRTLSFPLATWAFVTGHVVVGAVLCAAAVLTPSFAVMAANAVDRRRAPGDLPERPVQGLGAAPTREPETEGAPRTEPPVIVGTVLHRAEADPTVRSDAS